ncbi:MAG: hypothetical protein ACX931_06605 [Saccharospirillum sp.]
MADTAKPGSLIEDLEAIRNSLDRIAQSEPVIPVLDEVVDKQTPRSINPDNPFLSSQSLSELIRIRNEAEVRSAEELARLAPLRPIGRVQASPPAPDPEQIADQLQALCDSWIEEAMSHYLAVFEQELRARLEQDVQTLVRQWYEQQGLPVPEAVVPPPPKDGAP